MLAALLARIEDERVGVRDALDELDRKSLDLRALRAFKKVFDDFALGKDADAKVSRDDLVTKDGKPVMIQVPVKTSLVDALRRDRESAHAARLSELEKKKQDPAQMQQFFRDVAHQVEWHKAMALKAKISKLPAENARIDAEIAVLRSKNDQRKAALADGTRPMLDIELSAAAEHFNVLLSVSRVSDVQKLIEQINNLISEESTEAQKLSTVANDKYQQLTQLVRELSGMIRMRHEGRLSTVNRI
ncbi:MAG: hypothetical protein ACRYHA_34660 [Janthinobacterium lividum]